MTQKPSPSSKLTDQQLRDALAGLREDVAAPADFRAKLMLRLQREGLVQGSPVVAPAGPGFWRRLSAALTPQRLGLAASLILVLMVVVRFLPQAPLQSPAQAAASAAPIQAASGPAIVAPVKRAPAVSAAPDAEVLASAPPVKETLPEALLDETAVPKAEAAVGGASPAAPASAQQFGAAIAQASSLPSTGAGAPIAGGGAFTAAVAKPTVVVIEPTATPALPPLVGDSELRGNVIRASQGQAAVLLYRVPAAGHVHVEVFDRLGRSVAVLRDADEGVGSYDLRWSGQMDNGSMAASGIYVMRLSTPSFRAQHKLALVR